MEYAIEPTEPGLWWREGFELPVRIREDGPPWYGFCWQALDGNPHVWYRVRPDGKWIAPCVKPARVAAG